LHTCVHCFLFVCLFVCLLFFGDKLCASMFHVYFDCDLKMACFIFCAFVWLAQSATCIG
jgi:hypothetical protein